MKVIDHEPGLWFLLGDDDRLFLEVNCEHSAVGYNVLIELDESERAQQTAQGRAYLSKSAEAINYSAPGARGSQSSYKSRNISPSTVRRCRKRSGLGVLGKSSGFHGDVGSRPARRRN